MNTNVICKILSGNTKYLLLNKECHSKQYLFFHLFKDKQFLFKRACKYEYIDHIKLLLRDPKFNPSYDNNSAIQYACQRQLVKVVKLLLQDSRVDPSVDKNYSIRYACSNG